MIANDTLDALEKQVARFLSEETYKPMISDRYYAKDLGKSLDEKLAAITKDLEDDHEALLKEDCETSAKEFKSELRKLQERMIALKAKYEGALDVVKAKDNPSIVEVEVSFCEKISRVFESIISNLETWATESLSKAEANKNYFGSVNYTPEELGAVYDNLIREKWILKSSTSRADFLYYFTGEGLCPYNRIRWQKPVTWLSLFVEEVANDTKKWAKAALIFETKDPNNGQWDAVTRKSLSVSFRSVNDADSFPEVCEKVMKMFPRGK